MQILSFCSFGNRVFQLIRNFEWDLIQCFDGSHISVQRQDVIGIKLFRTYLFHVEYWCMNKNLHIYSSLFLYGFSIKAKRKATLGYRKWVSLQHIFTGFFVVACNIPTSTAARKKFSCASGTVYLKDHSFSSIWWKSDKKACIESFSIHQQRSRTKNWAIFTYRHLPSHLKHSLHLNFPPSATFTLSSLYFRIRSKCISCQF